VQIQPVTEDIAESLGLADAKRRAGLRSAGRRTGEEAAGVEAGDVITGRRPKPSVASPKELARLIGNMEPGKVGRRLAVWRDGKTEKVTVKLGDAARCRQAGEGRAPAPADANALEDLGLTVTRAEDGKGVVVTDVDPDSEAATRGIQPGDVITAVNSKEVGERRRGHRGGRRGCRRPAARRC
jgi:serine protease Do